MNTRIFSFYTAPGKACRKLLMLAPALIFFSPAVMAQWDTQSPVPTNMDIRGIGAPSAERVFLATDDNSFDNSGALIESNDGGATWVQRDIPFSLYDPFYGLFFLDSQFGWAYGNINYRTTDGGTTWTELPLLGSAYFMKFYTPAFGLTTGNFGQYISHDGGLNWVESPEGMGSFDFAGDLTGLGTSENGIYLTTDGGNTFNAVYTGSAISVVYLSATIAMGIVDGGFVRSTDGGASWTPGANAEDRQRLTSVSQNVVLAWGRAGNFPDYDDRVLRSGDGGLTWTDLGEIMPEGINDFVVTGPATVIASGLTGNMFRSTDAGLNWTQTFTSPGQQVGYLSSAVPVFADAQTGYFGFGAGFVIKTTDGGASWSQISSGSGMSLNDIDRFPNGHLIAVGENGTLISSDGLSPWLLGETFSQHHLKAVHIIDQNNVAVVDEPGQVYLSADGGLTWNATAGTPADFTSAEDVHFTDENNGWVTGSGFNTGALYHTTDGGNTWMPVPEILGVYVSVDVAGTNVWAANVTGLFYCSTDIGANWIQGEIPGSHQIRDMDFYDANNGYAVGMWGEAFRTGDGGITWEVLPNPNTQDDFTDIFLVGADELWLSTNNNMVYYSATGGQNWAVMEAGSAGFGNFSAVSANPAGDAWIVGFQGYIEHFTGPPSPPLNQPPVASFSFSANGLTADFTDASTDADGIIVSWAWDFGDGNISNLQNPSHTYENANTYVVTLTVTDDNGDTGNTLQIIVVQPGPGGTFGDFTEVTPPDPLFVTPQDEDFWVITTAPADYDSDGDLDVAVLGYYVVYNESVEEKLVLLRNDGPAGGNVWDFSYFEVSLGGMTTGSSDVAWGDADGDGDLDLVVGTDGATLLYRNDAGTLVLTDTGLPGYWEDNSQADFDLRSVTWADYDNDGDPDLLLPSVFDFESFSYQTKLMRNDGTDNNGDLIFTETDSVFAATSHAQSAWADFDSDQDLDLLLVNISPLTEGGFIRRYRNDGNGAFVGEDILGSLSVEHGEAQWGDYDGDGDLDILVAGNLRETDGSYTHMALRIYHNDNESYVPLDVIADLPGEGWFDLTAATWADYDSDGDMDILLAGNYNSGSNIEGRARIYTNNDGVFTDSGNELPAPRASGDRGGTFSWLDIDGEGDLDYFIAGQYFVPGGNGLVEAQMHLYRNDAPGQNLAPLAPSGLEVVLPTENSALLTWFPGSDDHTPGSALTYNLELFRNNVSVALPARTPEPGNVSAVTEWLLTGLENGEYKWTLRTVDAAYIGSNIATGEFNIGEIISVDEISNFSSGYNLGQNYPNPFSSKTIIKYKIPFEGPASLTVYNTAGKEIVTLVNEVKQPGSYEVMMDAGGLAEGIYFYRLQSGIVSETKKLTVMKF
ncbi:MAG: FG-GAP-like repeat-containing protein [Bacteroidota bacterium]